MIRTADLKIGNAFFQFWVGRADRFIQGPGNKRIEDFQRLFAVVWSAAVLNGDKAGTIAAMQKSHDDAIYYMGRGTFDREDHLPRSDAGRFESASSGRKFMIDEDAKRQ